MSPLKKWLKAAKIAERKELAERAGTTMGYLNQVANGHREIGMQTGHKVALAAAAIRVRSLERINRLPSLDFGDLSPICKNCTYYKKCKFKE